MPESTDKRRPTLAMVAREAGVSAPTVSKVLNDEAQLVNQAADQLENVGR